MSGDVTLLVGQVLVYLGRWAVLQGGAGGAFDLGQFTMSAFHL